MKRGSGMSEDKSPLIPEDADKRAQPVVLDQVLFTLDDDRFLQLMAFLDAPLESNPGLARLMAVQAPWLSIVSRSTGHPPD